MAAMNAPRSLAPIPLAAAAAAAITPPPSIQYPRTLHPSPHPPFVSFLPSVAFDPLFPSSIFFFFLSLSPAGPHTDPPSPPQGLRAFTWRSVSNSLLISVAAAAEEEYCTASWRE